MLPTLCRLAKVFRKPKNVIELKKRSGNVKVCPSACRQNRWAQPGTPAGWSTGRRSCLPHACSTDARPEERYAGRASGFSSRSHCCAGPFSLRPALQAVSAREEPSKAPAPSRSCQARLQAGGQVKPGTARVCCLPGTFPTRSTYRPSPTLKTKTPPCSAWQTKHM